MYSNIKIALIKSKKTSPNNYCFKWSQYLEQYGASSTFFDYSEQNLLSLIHDYDGVMWHFAHTIDDKQSAPKILDAIELGLQIPVFPNHATRWHFDEKVSQHYLLLESGFSTIRSWIFWKHEEALDFIKNCSYPIVMKLSSGAGSANVIKIDSYKMARSKVNQMFHVGFFPYSINEFADTCTRMQNVKKNFRHAWRYLLDSVYPPLPNTKPYGYLPHKNYIYFQEFLPGNTHDIRISVIGDRAFGYIRHNRPGDFRASGSGNFDPDPANIPIEAVKIAHAVSQKFGFQSMSYDFLTDPKGNLLINEMSYCYVNWMVKDCPGHWDRSLNWHDGHMWPEQAHVEDFLCALNSKPHRPSLQKVK